VGSDTFHAPFTHTQLPPWEIQWPATQTEPLLGGSSQCAATHFHWPASEFQCPPIHTYAGEGGGPETWASAAERASSALADGDIAKAIRNPAAPAAAANGIRILEFMGLKFFGYLVCLTPGKALLFRPFLERTPSLDGRRHTQP
jgi:hypothetical protein